MKKMFFLFLSLFFLFVSGTYGQSVTISEIHVNPSAGRYPKVLIAVKCKIQVEGKQGQKLFFKCHIYKQGQPVSGGYQVYTATPPYSTTVWNQITFRLLQRFFIDRKCWGQELTAVISVLDQGTNQTLGQAKGDFQFGKKIVTHPNSGGIAPAGRTPNTTPTIPSRPSGKATLTNIKIDPSSRNQAGQEEIIMTCTAQIEGMQGRTALFKIYIQNQGQVVSGCFESFSAQVPQPITTWNRVYCTFKKALLLEKLGSASQQLSITIEVYDLATNTSIGQMNAPFALANPNSSSPTQPQLINPDVPQNQNPYFLMSEGSKRFTAHPQGRNDLRFDPYLVGEWMTMEYIKPIGEAFMKGNRNTLKGVWKFIILKFYSNGTAQLEEYYPGVIVQGNGKGSFLFTDKPDKTTVVSTWGMEGGTTPNGMITLLRLEFPGRTFARGLYLSQPEINSFIFLYFDEQKQKYDERRMIYSKREVFIQDWNKNSDKLVKANLGFIEAREFRIYANNYIRMNQMMMFNFGMNMLNQSNQTSLNISNNIR